MKRYSAFAVAREALRYHTGWERAWRSPEPKRHYDVIIVGAGGHGLATAYYLGKNFGITNVAIIEKGWLGGGNTGRNTTIIRSNYLQDPSAAIYEKARSLYETMSQDLNYNVMFSQRSHITLLHSPGAIDATARNYNIMRLTGTPDTEIWDLETLKRTVPHLNYGPNARFPIMGAAVQKRAGTARHDAVAWGYARAADQLGVDILQNCEVTGISRDAGKVVALETAQDPITANAICPGYVLTPLVEAQIPDTMAKYDMSREDVIKNVMLERQPSKEFATVEQLGGTAVFLASEAAAQITGTTISVDGGWTAL